MMPSSSTRFLFGSWAVSRRLRSGSSASRRSKPRPAINRKPRQPSPNGNFVVSEIKIAIAPKDDPSKTQAVELQNPSADFSQESWPVASAIDGNDQTGWAIMPQFGKPHEAIFESKEDAGFDGGAILT